MRLMASLRLWVAHLREAADMRGDWHASSPPRAIAACGGHPAYPDRPGRDCAGAQAVWFWLRPSLCRPSTP